MAGINADPRRPQGRERPGIRAYRGRRRRRRDARAAV